VSLKEGDEFLGTSQVIAKFYGNRYIASYPGNAVHASLFEGGMDFSLLAGDREI